MSTPVNSLLGSLPIPKTLNEAINLPIKFVTDRLAKIDIFDETRVDMQKQSPWYQLGSFIYLFWIITVVTGLILVAFYIPTIDQAYDSIELIRENPLMAILRACHKYGGDAIIIAATLRAYRIWFNGEYKNKGEFNFIVAMVTLLAAMYSGLSGYLLIWNQRAFWATKVFATFPTYLDIMPAVNQWFLPHITGLITGTAGTLTHQGVNTSQILLGGSSIGQATMTRFFSLHFAISLICLIIVELYFYANRAKRININRWQVLILIGMLVFTSIVLPAESGSRANPEVTPLPILSDWYFLALYQLLKYMDPYWATIWTVAIPFGFVAISFLDFGTETNPWRRPIFTMGMIIGFIDFIVFSILIIFNQADINTHPPFWYAQMLIMFTLGEIWHFGLYKDMKVWLAWYIPTTAFSVWYFFLHCLPKPQLPESLSWFYSVYPSPDIAANMAAHPWISRWLLFTALMTGLTLYFFSVVQKSKALPAEANA